MKKVEFIDILSYSIISLFAIFCILPMVLIVMVSVTSERMILQYGYRLIPKEFSLEAYRMIFTGNPLLGNAYAISAFVTVVGTVAAVIITGTAAYTLSNKLVKYRNSLALFFFITMVFNGGIVPWYLICRGLGLQNNVASLIIPSLLFSPFNLFLARNFMNSIPDSLRESATIDGAGDAAIAFRIYFPLSVPVLATIALFYGVGYWNDWWNAIMLIDRIDMYPLQYVLFQLQSNIAMLRDLQSIGLTGEGIVFPHESFKMATVIVTIGPIIFLYPYLQRYFVKGLIIGSIKG